MLVKRQAEQLEHTSNCIRCSWECICDPSQVAADMLHTSYVTNMSIRYSYTLAYYLLAYNLKCHNLNVHRRLGSVACRILMGFNLNVDINISTQSGAALSPRKLQNTRLIRMMSLRNKIQNILKSNMEKLYMKMTLLMNRNILHRPNMRKWKPKANVRRE